MSKPNYPVPQWAKELWKELTTPPVWMNSPPDTSAQNNSKWTSNGTKAGKQKKPYKQEYAENEEEEDEGEDEDEAEIEDEDEDEDEDEETQPEKSPYDSAFTRDLPLVYRASGFDPRLIGMYPFQVRNAAPNGAVLRVETKDGTIAVKRSNLRKQHIQYMWNALQYAEKNGFSRLSRILLNNQQIPYTVIGDQVYYASQWIPGEQADFSSMVHVGEAALTIAEFHQATKGFRSPDYLPPRGYALKRTMQARIKDFDLFTAKARSRRKPDAIDRHVLRYTPYYKKQAQQAAALLDTSACRNFLQQDEEASALCHLDITPDNLVYANRRMHLIDFDLMGYGPRMLDLGHLIRRSLHACDWQRDPALIALVQANNVAPLRNAEYRLLQSLLAFPHSYWRSLRRHYMTQKTPYTLAKLQKLQTQESARQEFLKGLADHADRHKGL